MGNFTIRWTLTALSNYLFPYGRYESNAIQYEECADHGVDPVRRRFGAEDPLQRFTVSGLCLVGAVAELPLRPWPDAPLGTLRINARDELRIRLNGVFGMPALVSGLAPLIALATAHSHAGDR